MIPTRLAPALPAPRNGEALGVRHYCAAFIFATCHLLLLLGTAMVISAAEPPTLDYLFPAGGAQRSTNQITVGGKFDPWPPQVWIDCDGVRFEPQTNKGVFNVTIEAGAPIGPHLVRMFNADGASAPKYFVVGSGEEISEVETNDSWSQAQVITSMPVTVNGRLEKGGDVDSFAVTLEAGKWFVASVDAYALGSPIDPHLTLLNDHGIRVAFNSDRAQSFDPLLAWKVEKSGAYILQIAGFAYPPGSDIRLAGSASTVYRLTLGQETVINSAFPVSLKAGCELPVQLRGWNLDDDLTNQTWNVHTSASNGSAKNHGATFTGFPAGDQERSAARTRTRAKQQICRGRRTALAGDDQWAHRSGWRRRSVSLRS